MRTLAVALLAVLSGCWQSKYTYYSDILSKPSSLWTEHECRTVIEANMEYNRFDIESPVAVVVTRISPLVVQAINREDQRRKEWTEEQYGLSLKEDLRLFFGLEFDPATGSVRDGRGNPYMGETQLDSLPFLVSVLDRNITGNISNSALAGAIFDLKNFPFSHHDIENFKDEVFLQNDRKELLKPNWVGGNREGRLVRNETFLAMFQLRQPGFHFLEDSPAMSLVLRGFEREIRLSFPVLSGK